MMRSSPWFRFALCVALVLALPGCKTVGGWFGGEKEERTERLEVEQLYSEAKKNLLQGDYSQARRYYTRLIARFPFGPYNEQ
jgi:outer membrane protein assembly factor BamD